MQQKGFAYGLVAAFAAVAAAKSDVTQLTKASFDDFITSNQLVLAEFYAPWCGHCKALAPEYEEAATALKSKDIKLAKVDCTEEADLCQEYGVEGYPTLKVFRGDKKKSSPFNGQRQAAAITSYMIKQSLPAVSLLTEETLADFKTADSVVLVAYIAADDKSSNETFTAVAESLHEDYLFGGINDAAVAAAEKVEFPSIVLYKDFDEGKDTFSGEFDAQAIKDFARAAATPLVGKVDSNTYAGYISTGLPLAYIFVETPEEREKLAEVIKPIAVEYKGKINFATIDASKYGAHADNLNLKSDKFPSFAIQNTTDNQKYPMAQEKAINYENVAAFVKEFSGGNMKASIKSEPIPPTQEGPVIVVVGKTYHELVKDDTKDVLLEFYAPWCGHCKSLAPKYEDLASQYASSEFKDQVVIAKIDATANDVPDKIEGFPTIKLYPAGGKDDPITYEGARTVESLVNFIKEKGKYKAGISIKEESTDEAAPAATAQVKDDKKEETKKEAKKEKTSESATEDVEEEEEEVEEEQHDEL